MYHVVLFSGRETELSAVLAKRMFVCVRPSARPSICHTCNTRIIMAQGVEICLQLLQKDVSSFLRPNFAILNLEIHHKRVR